MTAHVAVTAGQIRAARQAVRAVMAEGRQPSRLMLAVALAQDAPEDPWVTPREVAERLNVSVMTVTRLIHGGELAACRFGRSLRIRRSDLDAYVNAAWVDAAAE